MKYAADKVYAFILLNKLWAWWRNVLMYLNSYSGEGLFIITNKATVVKIKNMI